MDSLHEMIVVSGTLGGGWCGHLAWRDKTSNCFIRVYWLIRDDMNSLYERIVVSRTLSGGWCGHLAWRDKTSSEV
jgi:hypothetical protein